MRGDLRAARLAISSLLPSSYGFGLSLPSGNPDDLQGTGTNLRFP